MKNNSIFQNRVVRIALITLGLLAIPILAMTFNLQIPDPGSSSQNGVNWTLSDFVVMGTLIFGTGLLIDYASRKAGMDRAIVIAAIVFLFLWLWAELAVGVFTNWGS